MNWKILVIILIIIVVGIVGYLILSNRQSTPFINGNNVEESIPQPPKLPD